LTALALAAAPTHAADRVDRLVAVVGEDVITLSDLRLEEALRAVDVSPLPPFARPGQDTETLLVDYRILLDLAGDVRLYQPEARQVRARLEAVRGAFPRAAEYATFLYEVGLSEDDLARLLRRRMVIEAYVARYMGISAAGDPARAIPPRAQDPAAHAAAYSAAYEAWMAPRRAEASIRRIEARGAAAP